MLGSNAEAKTFLSRNGKVIIRMRGLPFDAVAKDVVSEKKNNYLLTNALQKIYKIIEKSIFKT